MIRRLHALALAVLVAAPGVALPQRAAAQTTTVILVRHAEKMTTPGDPNPKLTPAGEQRARDLVTALGRRRVNAVITTDLERTRLTGRPTAERFHLTPEEVQVSGDVLVHAAAVADAIRSRHRGQTVLVVGHSNTVPKIIAALGGSTLGDICDTAYSNLFTLVIPRRGTPRLAHTHYGAADPPADHDCVDGLKQEHHH